MPFNWARELRKFLCAIGAKDVWTSQNLELIIKNRKSSVEKLKNHLISMDVQKVINSNFNLYYRNVSSLGLPEKYLEFNVHINKIRLLAQLRLASKKISKISINNDALKFNSEEPCNLCDLNQTNDIIHFILECPLFSMFRNDHISKYLSVNDTKLGSIERLLVIEDERKINDLYFFLKKSFKLRKFILNL